MSNQRLIRKLESSDIEARREAARTLAQYPASGAIMERDERDISDAIGPLAVAFFDEDAEVRKHAGRALHAAQGDQQDLSSAIPALVSALSDERVDVRRAASLILRDTVVKGLDAAPFESQLRARLTDPVDEVKWGVADTLAFHYAARKRWGAVANLLGNADPDVAQETAGTLAEFWFRFDYRPIAADLVTLLGAESLELRLVAARALVCHPRDASDLTAAFSVLLECVSHGEARIRKASVEALGMGISRFFRQHPQIGERADLAPADWDFLAPVTGALPALEEALSDPKCVIQTAAIEGLATFLAALPVTELGRYEGYIQLFRKRLRSRHESVKKRAAEALTVQWVRTRRWDELLALLTGQPKIVKRQVLITLSTNETIRGLDFAPLVPNILKVLSDPDGDLRYAAQRALERVDANELLEPLESEPIDTDARRTLLRGVRSRVHRASLKALKSEVEGRSAADKIDLLIGHLSHEKCAVRAWSAESLWWIGQAEDISAAIPQLIQLLDDPDSATRVEAANALGDAARYDSIGQAHERLMQLTKDESAEVRKRAFRALWMSADYSGGDLSAVLPELCQTLRTDPDQENRGEAAFVISTASRGHDLAALVPDLVAALADDFQRVRFYSARALHYAAEGGADIQPAIPVLARLLEDEPSTAAWAAEALLLYASNAARTDEVLEVTRTLDSNREPVARVVEVCEKRLGGE